MDKISDVTSQLRCVSGNMSGVWLHVSQSALMWIIGLVYVALCMGVRFEGWCYDLIGFRGSLGLVCVKFVMGLGFRQCLYERYFGF